MTTFVPRMVLNYIWIFFFLTAMAFALFALVTGDYSVFPAIIDATFDSAKTGFEISLGLTGVLSLWMGFMAVGEKAGLRRPVWWRGSRACSVRSSRVCSPMCPRVIPLSATSS